jgi:hypothetical protein
MPRGGFRLARSPAGLFVFHLSLLHEPAKDSPDQCYMYLPVEFDKRILLRFNIRFFNRKLDTGSP